MRLRTLLAVGLLAIAMAVAAAIVGVGRGDGDTTQLVSEHGATVPAVARTVTVSRAMPLPSAHERRLSAMLEAGDMPDATTMAEVMTDSDCTPDAEMISRCRNVVRLEDGREVVLRHPHRMSEVPCLAPGELVRLVPSGIA